MHSQIAMLFMSKYIIFFHILRYLTKERNTHFCISQCHVICPPLSSYYNTLLRLFKTSTIRCHILELGATWAL